MVPELRPERNLWCGDSNSGWVQAGGGCLGMAVTVQTLGSLQSPSSASLSSQKAYALPSASFFKEHALGMLAAWHFPTTIPVGYMP